MRLTRYADFCFRVLVHVGLKGGALSTTREISETFHISNNHLMKVVYDLNIKGYLATIRGKHGGIRLGRPPADINLGAVFRAVEDDLMLVECMGADSQCRISPSCQLREILHEASQAFLAVLDRYTLQDILERRSELSRLLGIEMSGPLAGV